MISEHDLYGEKIKIIFFSRFVSMEMVAIFDFKALTKVHTVYNIKTASSIKCSEKSHTHRRHTNEETKRSVFTFVA